MKNDFCDLSLSEILALRIPNDVAGLLLSPFQWNERNGYIMVPTDSFKDMIDLVTAQAKVLDAEALAEEKISRLV